MKNGKRVENNSNMKKAIEDAITAYRGKTGQKTGSIDPVAFREYVEITPSQGEALKHMNRLRNLFSEILPVGDAGSRKGMGLTPVEAAISRKVLVESLDVQGMEADKLETAILAHPAHVAAAKAQAMPQAKPQAQPQPKPQAQPQPQPQPKPQAQPQPQAKPVAEPQVQPKPAVKPQAKPTFQPQNDAATTPAK
jgi:hypothetical protein